MMENKEINLSNGSNAFDNLLFNGAGFFENLTDKNADQEIPNDFSFAGFDTPNWFMENDNSKFVDIDYLSSINETYSLDDLLDADALMSPEGSNFSSEFMETPLGSPMSSSDEASYDLNDLFLPAAPDTVLENSKVFEKPSPLSEHTYAASNLPLVDFTVAVGNAEIESDSSGESLSASEDMLAQFLNGQFDLITSSLESPVANSTVDITAILDPLSLNSLSEVKDVPSKTNSTRFSPYKKKRKTTEQKQRKKMQNRNAASKYRCRKKDEMTEMFTEAEELEGKNRELKGKVDGLKKEIDYLKNLMLDVIKVRLAKNNTSLDDVLSKTLMSVS